MADTNDDQQPVDRGSNEPHCYPSHFEHLEYRRRFEHEGQRRTAAIEHLWQMSRNDSTVNAFLECWRRGSFPSFEEAVCQLAVQLATEKAEYMKVATKAIQLSPSPSIIVKNG